MSFSLIFISPFEGDSIWNNSLISDDFPLPVRPQIPTLVPYGILKLNPDGNISEESLNYK